METAMQPRSLKLTIKLKRESSGSNCTVTADHVDNVAGEPNAPVDNVAREPNAAVDNVAREPNAAVDNVAGEPNAVSSSQSPGGLVENDSAEGGENPSPENHYQLVLYDPAAHGGELINPEPISSRPPSATRQHPFSNQTPRVLPAVGAFTVQCAECFKWRLIPTKEKYEEIREHIIEQPFSCETAREWKPEISCEDPPDIEQDGSRLWAIDKPNIAQPPPGWQRLLRIRGEGSTKFADVYYISPSGKRLRSMVEVQRYLNEHPNYVEEGVKLSQFSFQIPKPLQDNYVRKRPARAATPNDTDGHGTPGSAYPVQVEPLAWASPDAGTNLQLGTSGLSTQHSDAAVDLEVQSAKKIKTSPEKTNNGDSIYDQKGGNVGESSQP